MIFILIVILLTAGVFGYYFQKASEIFLNEAGYYNKDMIKTKVEEQKEKKIRKEMEDMRGAM